MTDEEGFEALCARFGPEVQAIARAARALVVRLDPEVFEVVWDRQGTVGYGVGPKKMTEHYAYLALHGRHLNLGCYRGALLPDPAGLLGGPGALLRHTKLRSPADVEQPALADLLREARAERVAALGLG